MENILRGPWNQRQIDTYLSASSFPLRLSCVGADGFPRIASLWYRYEAGEIFCVTHCRSTMALLLQADGRVGFEISPNEPPYHGVRGQGRTTLYPLDKASLLEGLLEHYLGDTKSGLATWLLKRSDEEVVINISPTRLYSWDYRDRMANTKL